MYVIEWKMANGVWAQHSTGWTQEEAMFIIWTSGLTGKVCFRVAIERRVN
jgi:hypothetical protein